VYDRNKHRWFSLYDPDPDTRPEASL
jgi:hypothetical protein